MMRSGIANGIAESWSVPVITNTASAGSSARKLVEMGTICAVEMVKRRKKSDECAHISTKTRRKGRRKHIRPLQDAFQDPLKRLGKSRKPGKCQESSLSFSSSQMI